MSNEVFFGSARQRRLHSSETLPAKLDRIIERLALKDRVKGETVAIKMHLGGGIGYTTVHPVFVRKIVEAVKAGGGTPFCTDTPWAVLTAYQRGYTQETLGCALLPTAGLNDQYYKVTQEPYKNIKEWKTAGEIADATFLIDLAHAKGHPCCAYGGVFKNLALGCQVAEIRSQLHDVAHYDQYWFPEKCSDDATIQAIIDACPLNALVRDKDNPKNLHLHTEPCNGCGRCLEVAPAGSLKIDPVNFNSFQEACAVSAKQTLRTFDKEKCIFLNLATHITPVCDCFGMTLMSVLPDVGIFGGNDICAVEQASLDAIGKEKLILENMPGDTYQVQLDLPHPLQQIHGRYKDPYDVIRFAEKLGLGSSDYTLVDVMEEEAVTAAAGHISAAKL